MIQYLMKLVIHLYTGMRDQEVMRMPFNCIHKVELTPALKTDKGNACVEERMVSIVSTTTKYTTEHEEATWYCPDTVERAIRILQIISEGICSASDFDKEKTFLFVAPANLCKVKKKNKISSFSKLDGILESFGFTNHFVITQQDYQELQTTDPERDFSEPKFQVGKSWTINTHQFRRSLAFYAKASGFVKTPTLQRQYKQFLERIARYYSRNFENANTIFGCYDPETKTFSLPSDHIINDCQLGADASIATQLINDLLLSDDVLYGKSGGYIEKQRNKLREGEVLIEDIRSETLNRVKTGELFYKETLLGGCMSKDKCDSHMLGDVTACLTCKDATIKADKVNLQINQIEKQREQFERDSGEYQILSIELNSLQAYKDNRIERGGNYE